MVWAKSQISKLFTANRRMPRDVCATCSLVLKPESLRWAVQKHMVPLS